MFVRVKTPKRILVIRPDAIGDVVLALPVVSALKIQYPDADIYMLQQPYTAPLTEDHPHIKEVVIDWKKTGKAKGFLGFLNYATFIKSFRFDMVIHVYLDTYYALLCWKAGIPIRIGDSQKVLLRPWLTHPQPQPIRNLSLHEVEQNLALLSAFFPTSAPSPPLSLPSRAPERQRVLAILSKAHLSSTPFIIIHPSTGNGNRPWHPEGYAAFISLVRSQTPYAVIVTGYGDRDLEIVSRIRKNTSSPFISLVNQLTLAELMELIRLASVVIGTDTGPTHIAAACHIPVLGFSPTKHVKSLRWGPWQTSHLIVGHPSACDIRCNPYTCKLSTCLDAITPSHAFENFLSLVQSPPNPLSRREWVRQSIRVMLVEADEQLTRPLNDSKIAYFVFRSSLFNVIKLRAFITSHDCVVIHTLTPIPKWYQHVIRVLCAPLMTVPPIFIQTSPDPSEDICNFYMLHFSKWYPN